MTMQLTPQKSPKKTLSPSEKTFKKLSTKVKRLETAIKKDQEKLDNLLSLYAHNLAPQEQRFRFIFQETIKRIYSFYIQKSLFSKKEKKVLRGFLLVIFENLSFFIELQDCDPKVQEILSALLPKPKKEKEPTEEPLNEEEFSSSFEEEEPFFHFSFKEEQKPLSSKELEDKKSLGTIYRDLAKKFHPDLELDPKKKEEKEKLMKELTMAYRAGDVHTLLNLQKIHLPKKPHSTEEDLDALCTLLQQRIDSLQQEKYSLALSSRYQNLFGYLRFGLPKAEEFMKQTFIENSLHLAPREELYEALLSDRAIEVLREIIAEEP